MLTIVLNLNDIVSYPMLLCRTRNVVSGFQSTSDMIRLRYQVTEYETTAYKLRYMTTGYDTSASEYDTILFWLQYKVTEYDNTVFWLQYNITEYDITAYRVR